MASGLFDGRTPWLESNALLFLLEGDDAAAWTAVAQLPAPGVDTLRQAAETLAQLCRAVEAARRAPAVALPGAGAWLNERAHARALGSVLEGRSAGVVDK